MTKKRLLTPGPTPLPENVRLSLAQDMIHHRKDEFVAIMDTVQQGLQYLFQTKQTVLPLSCSGTGAMDAAVTNLFSPGEKVLVIQGGKFGERWLQIAKNHGLETIVLDLPAGSSFSSEQVADLLQKHSSVKGILVQASETSTGVRHPVHKLTPLKKDHDFLLVVDGISAVGVSPCPMDAWDIDCLVTGSQKGLMLPPGLAFISLSPRAWDRVKIVRPTNFYFNLLGELKKSKAHQTLWTSPVNLIVGLQASLSSFQTTGLDAIFLKQRALTAMARTGAKEIGLDFLAHDHFTWGLTSLVLPPGLDGIKLLAIASSTYGVQMAGGQGDLKGKIVRLGHMGHVDFGDILTGLYALKKSYVACGGFSGTTHFLEQAAEAYELSLEEEFSHDE